MFRVCVGGVCFTRLWMFSVRNLSWWGVTLVEREDESPCWEGELFLVCLHFWLSLLCF